MTPTNPAQLDDVRYLTQEARKPSLPGVVLPILQYPHPLLSKPAAPVLSDIANDTELHALLENMVKTMTVARGVGLAAPQVGVSLRVLVALDEYGSIHKVINPRVVRVSDFVERSKEGCLSFMGLFVNVTRPAAAEVEYFDEHGLKQTATFGSFLARVIQHEVDHLDGKTMLDRLQPFERREALRKNTHAQRKVKKLQKALSR